VCGKAIVFAGAAPTNADKALCLRCLKKCPAATFGQKLMAFRLAANWTRKELARRAGISQNLIGYYERDQHVPGPTFRVQLANALGIQYQTLWASVPPAGR
jgi:DNA-binding XRE family transcriptional regulator